MTGWVPIRLAWLAEPQRASLQVEWCWLGSERFLHPFFDHTIEHVQRLPFNGLFTHRTSIDELIAWHAASPGIPPTGFIFHMSRCGSTLVSRMLASLPENVVISEAGPVDYLARALAIPEETRSVWLRAMVSALGQKRAGQETRYFIKFDSVTTDALPFIRRTFPAVPWIFLYRDPEEVLASQLSEPGAAMSPGIVRGPAVIDAPFAETLSMSLEEHAARIIGTVCRCACQSVVDHAGLLVNYTQLPEAVWQDIAAHFGIRFSTAQIETMWNIAAFHAKHPRAKFAPDGQFKRLGISPAAREAAARWIQPHFEELEKLRLRPSPLPVP
ncbi:MAG TPA: hypothetical protein VGL72_21875 [Bryobacteraceae bacterium]|jgi:hypothetical protein